MGLFPCFCAVASDKYLRRVILSDFMELKLEQPANGAKQHANKKRFLNVAPLVVGLALLPSSCTVKWERNGNAGTKEAVAAATEKAGKIRLDAPENCIRKAEIYYMAGMDAETAKVADDCNSTYLGLNLPTEKVTMVDVTNPLGYLLGHKLPKREDFAGTGWWQAPIEICLKAGYDEKLGDIYMSRAQYGRAAHAYRSAGLKEKAESASRRVTQEMESQRKERERSRR